MFTVMQFSIKSQKKREKKENKTKRRKKRKRKEGKKSETKMSLGIFDFSFISIAGAKVEKVDKRYGECR